MGPQRIVCLTEETTEWLYLLGEQDAHRRHQRLTPCAHAARAEKPRVVLPRRQGRPHRRTAARPVDRLFRHAGGAGRQAHPRRPERARHQPAQRGRDLLHPAPLVASIVGAQANAPRPDRAVPGPPRRDRRRRAVAGRRPRVFFEEWDELLISAIQWVSELVGVAGGDDVFPNWRAAPGARPRRRRRAGSRRAPDIVVGSWCGKKFRPEKVAARPGWSEVPAVQRANCIEIKSRDIPAARPAALTDGWSSCTGCSVARAARA